MWNKTLFNIDDEVSAGTAPEIQDAFRRSVISSISFFMSIIIIVSCIARNFISPMKSMVLITDAAVALVMLLIPILIRRNISTFICGVLFLTSVFAIGLIGGLSNGGMMAPVTVIFVLMPILGFFITGKRGANLSITLSFLGIFILLIAEHYSWVQPLNSPEKYTLYKSLIYLFTTAAIYTIGAVYENSRRLTEKALRELSAKSAHASKMSTLIEMAVGISHEINNPLAIIQGKARMIRRQLESNKGENELNLASLTKIELNVDRIAKIISGLKLFTSSTELDPMVRVSIQKIIKDSLKLCRGRFEEAAIKFETDIENDAFIQCSPAQISQIILILLSNAHDAVKDLPEKWVKLKISTIDRSVLMSVTDSGKGLSLEVSKRIMEPFFTTKAADKGTGLGLSIALGIANRHQGSLKYESSSPNTQFVLELKNDS